MHPCAASYLLAGVVILHATIGTGLRQVLDASPHIIVFISDCCCCSSARCSSTPRGLDDVLTANAVCFLALGFWLPIRHALIERHYFPSPPHFFSAVASSFSHTLATVPHRAGLPSFSLTRASSRRTSLQLLVAQAMRITVSLIAPRSFPGRVPGEGFEPQTAAWSSSRWRELRASPTDSRHISYVQSHSIELNRSDLDFWPAHCGVTSHLWLHGLLTPAISGSTTRSSTLQARPGASLFVDTLIPPMRACALLVERRSASRGQHFCRRGVQMQLQTAPLHSAPSWRWPPPWRTNPAASCATSAC